MTDLYESMLVAQTWQRHPQISILSLIISVILSLLYYYKTYNIVTLYNIYFDLFQAQRL